MEYRIVFITAGNKEEADRIAKNLVEIKLAACVNIIYNIKSFYRWEEKIQQDEEILLVAKTKKSLVKELIQRTKNLHTYSCPEIITLPVKEGNPDYLKWIEEEVK